MTILRNILRILFLKHSHNISKQQYLFFMYPFNAFNSYIPSFQQHLILIDTNASCGGLVVKASATQLVG